MNDNVQAGDSIWVLTRVTDVVDVLGVFKSLHQAILEAEQKARTRSGIPGPYTWHHHTRLDDASKHRYEFTSSYGTYIVESFLFKGDRIHIQQLSFAKRIDETNE